MLKIRILILDLKSIFKKHFLIKVCQLKARLKSIKKFTFIKDNRKAIN